MNYSKVENPTWNEAKTSIDCLVTFDGLGAVPFAATQTDIYPHTIEIYNRCIAGDFGPVADYVKRPEEYPVEILIDAAQPESQGSQTL